MSKKHHWFVTYSFWQQSSLVCYLLFLATVKKKKPYSGGKNNNTFSIGTLFGKSYKKNFIPKFLIQRWKPPIISVRSDFSSVFRFSFSFKSQICTGRTEIMCLHFHFLQNANLDTHTRSDFLKCVCNVYRFAYILMKI